MAQNSELEHKHPTPGLYLVILTALIIGTCATWGIAFVDLGIWNPVVALVIAVTKAVLVILVNGQAILSLTSQAESCPITY